ncbi:MAG: hypothetical protein HC845_14525 [Akkermansiaceae bacterium]|nr:hypothetical protein [Akkermansiaceae bacterium]
MAAAFFAGAGFFATLAAGAFGFAGLTIGFAFPFLGAGFGVFFFAAMV